MAEIQFSGWLLNRVVSLVSIWPHFFLCTTRHNFYLWSSSQGLFQRSENSHKLQD